VSSNSRKNCRHRQNQTCRVLFTSYNVSNTPRPTVLQEAQWLLGTPTIAILLIVVALHFAFYLYLVSIEESTRRHNWRGRVR
jgi:hypothetical protein